jgi:hypothetical protein
MHIRILLLSTQSHFGASQLAEVSNFDGALYINSLPDKANYRVENECKALLHSRKVITRQQDRHLDSLEVKF